MDIKLKEQLAAELKQVYQDTINTLVDKTMIILEQTYDSLPETMSDEEKLDFIKGAVDTLNGSMVGSTGSLNVTELARELKQNIKGDANG